jgi:hypothetical protein
MKTGCIALLTALLSAVSVNGRAADDDILFTCALTDEDQSTPTYSPGSGRAEVWLERATLKVRWKVTFKDLTSPVTDAGMYGPENVGANAGQYVNFAPDKKFASPIEGEKVLSDGEFQYLVTGRTYVNVHTVKYKDGELRCQLRRQRQTQTPA